MQINLLIAGSREFNDYNLLKWTVIRFLFKNKILNKDITIISGHARGADKLGERFAEEFGIKTKLFIPDWDKFGKRAGMLRNIDMVNICDYAILCWNGTSKGTKHDIDLLNKTNKPYEIIYF